VTLTPRKQDILDTIAHLTATSNGIAPSLDEIGVVLKLSKAAVWEHAVALEESGYLKREPHRKRSLTLTELGRNSLSYAVCPHCGK